MVDFGSECPQSEHNAGTGGEARPMATGERATARRKEVDYPTSDGKTMAETDLHRDFS
jgi:hypothetical protein